MGFIMAEKNITMRIKHNPFVLLRNPRDNMNIELGKFQFPSLWSGTMVYAFAEKIHHVKKNCIVFQAYVLLEAGESDFVHN